MKIHVGISISLYQYLDHQLQDGMMHQHEFDHMRYIVQRIFDLKLQIHAIEAEPSLPLPTDVIGHTIECCRIYTQRVYLQGRYSSMYVLVYGELYTGPACPYGCKLHKRGS